MHPSDPTTIGMAYHRYGDFAFGITQADRLHHTYIIGQTGTGKSTLLGNLVHQDIEAGRGLCLIDPHGDLVDTLVRVWPDKVLHWEVANPTSPYGYNPLTRTDRPLRPLVAAGLIETLKKQWSDSWGARMEHLLRYALLALLDQPQADISQIVPLFLDKEFRKAVIESVSDEQVRTFWTVEFPKMNYLTAIDGVAPIANKLGAFLANPTIRKALCDPDKPLRFRSLMDDGKVLLIDFGKGQLGASTANVLGGLIVSNIMLAAFTRHEVAEAERRPFFLYVDEFHNLTTEALADLLPEARKYALGLILAHQHIGQMDRATHDAIIGNTGTIISLRLGARDAPLIARQFASLDPYHFTNLPNYRGYVQLLSRGTKKPSFSFTTLPLSHCEMATANHQNPYV